MKKLESLEKYVILPNVGFYGGFLFDGEDIARGEVHDEEEGYDFIVQQRIESGVLYTDISRKYTMPNGKEVREQSHQEVEVEKGQLLVFVEGLGFTISEHRMCTVDTAIEHYQVLKGGV